MMKIKSLTNDNTYILPLKNHLNIIATMNYKDQLIDCLEATFINKKKTKAIITDDNGEVVLPKEYTFIYIPYGKGIESNFEFKTKSIMNTEMVEIINSNPEYFLSLEKIRDSIRELLTDKGMYRVRKILSEGLNDRIDIVLNDFNISNILQMLEIIKEDMTESEQYIILYNLLLYLHREDNCIVYIDFPVDETVINWITNNQYDKKHYFIDNDALKAYHPALDNYSFIVLSDYDFLEEVSLNKKELKHLTYLFHSFVLQHLEYQTQKNIDLYQLFYDDSSTFFINFYDTETPKTA